MPRTKKERGARALLGILLVASLLFAVWEFRSTLPFGFVGKVEQAASAERKSSQAAAATHTTITALGRIEPREGVIRIAGPSRVAVVIGVLRVAKGDEVKTGDVLAVLDSYTSEHAVVDRLRAELNSAQRELARKRKLHSEGAIADTILEAEALVRDVARAQLRHAEAELARSTVRAPFDGQVLEIHARTGERVGPEGILELGRTDEMYAVAEVYETDVRRVKVGQRARVSSPALEAQLDGVVERVGMKIGNIGRLQVGKKEIYGRKSQRSPVGGYTFLGCWKC